VLAVLKNSIAIHQSRPFAQLKSLSSACCDFFSNVVYNIRNALKSSLFIFVLVLLQIYLWQLKVLYYRDQGFPIALCFAKGFGINLRVLSILLFLSMARTTMGVLMKWRLVRVIIPMGFNIQIHSFCGFCTAFHTIGHGKQIKICLLLRFA
jgi:hypothetical protein